MGHNTGKILEACERLGPGLTGYLNLVGVKAIEDRTIFFETAPDVSIDDRGVEGTVLRRRDRRRPTSPVSGTPVLRRVCLSVAFDLPDV